MKRSAVAFTLSLVVPSTLIVHKFFGMGGVMAYCAISVLVLPAIHRTCFARMASAFTPRWAMGLSAGLLIFLVLAFWIGYPIANSGLLGAGSDRDEHLNMGTLELLNGRYPYYQMGPSQYGSFIGQMPGALILAIPFVLLGNGAYQTLFWLIAFGAFLGWLYRDARAGLLLLFVILALAPAVMREYVTGSDQLAQSIYVLLFAVWTVECVPRPDVSPWTKWLSAVALGIGVSSIAVFPLVLPLVLSALVQRAGTRAALQSMAVTCIVFGVVTLPFVLYDPAGFTPFWTIGYVQPEHLPRFVGVGFAAMCVAVSVGCAMDRANGDLSVMLKYCTLALAVPVLVSMIPAALLDAGELDWLVLDHLVSSLVFGAVAFRPSPP